MTDEEYVVAQRQLLQVGAIVRRMDLPEMITYLTTLRGQDSIEMMLLVSGLEKFQRDVRTFAGSVGAIGDALRE